MAAKKIDWAVDWAVRLENASDAGKGKVARRGGRWLLLPAAGAGLYALATSGAFTRQAKDVIDQAKTLPDDLMSRLRQTTEQSTETPTRSSSGNGSRRRQRSRAGTSGTRRKTPQSR